MARMSASVVAKLFPRPTSALPRFDTCDCDVFMTFMNRASDMAACSAERFVVSPRSIIVRVKSTTCSVWMPSWPAASATAAISACDAGSSRASPRRPSSTIES